MKPETHLHDNHGDLRQRTEQCRTSGDSGSSANTGPVNAMEAQRLLQELEIHQIELEMQNRELELARNEAEEAQEIYRDLYDFAPIGYFTLSREGNVIMANLTGATLLGLERANLTGHPFVQWIDPDNREGYTQFLSGVFNGEDPKPIEVDIQQKGGGGFIASLKACKEPKDLNCRMMMTDITVQKEEEKAQRLLKIYTRSNVKLEAEVRHRQEVEDTLEIAKTNLNASLEKSERQRKLLLNLSHALLHAQEKQRKRISRELHDTIVQSLVAIQYEFELLAQESKGRFPGLQDQIIRTQDILEASIDLVHGFAFDLRPSALDNLGLGPTLEAFAARFHETSGITVTLQLFEDLGKIGSTERTMLFRVVQEAFNNVSTHAEARNVHLSITEKSKSLRMEITDDGIGMDLQKSESLPGEGRLGMIGMRERVEMLGGTLRILSKPGEYTTIRVDLPTPLKESIYSSGT